MEWKVFEQRVSDYFKQHGFSVKLNERVSGGSGVQYEVDVLAVDRRFNEVKVACQCKAWEHPVDRDSIIFWARVCEDIHAIPAFASASGYTDSALKVARKLGFIILAYDERIKALRKLEVDARTLFTEEPENTIIEAEQKLKIVDELIAQLNELYEKNLVGSEEAERLRSDIKKLVGEAISLYERALSLKPDKFLWFRLGDIYNSFYVYFDPELERKSKNEAMRCYMNALREHLKEFPDILRKLSSIARYANRVFYSELYDTLKPEYMLKMYLDRCPDDAEAWLELAENYVEIRRVNEADQACERALKVAATDPIIIARSSHIYERIVHKTHGDRRMYFLNKLIRLLRKLCELEPRSPLPWRTLAKIYSTFRVIEDREKCLEEAIRCMEECVKRGGGWSDWKMLGDLYFQKGDREKMLECYSKALEEKT